MLNHFLKSDTLEVGLDEVARGCLAGRVYSAAVIWNPYLEELYDVKIPNITDSKKLSPKKRENCRKFIETYAVDYGIGWVDEKEIDEINIRNASVEAMHRALNNLTVKPEHILVDGNFFKNYNDLDYTCIVKGDTKYFSIAAASILAKTHRDEYFNNLIDNNPSYEKYQWRKNNSYGTKEHIEAIKKYGITDIHRKTFGICKNYVL